jgi:hypothetical protein
MMVRLLMIIFCRMRRKERVDSGSCADTPNQQEPFISSQSSRDQHLTLYFLRRGHFQALA